MIFWVKWTLGLVLSLTVFFVLTLPWEESKETSKAYACLSNLKQQGTAMSMYGEDSDGRLPSRSHWMDVPDAYLKPDHSYALHCPNVPKGAYGYAFNAALSGAVVPKRAEVVPLVYESTHLERNASDRFESFPKPGRHEGKGNVVYADGHGRRVR